MKRKESMRTFNEEPSPKADVQKVEIGMFEPRDAEGVVELYRAIYGDSFPVKQVYDPDALRQSHESGDKITFVARGENGRVVGLSSCFRSAPGRSIRELGGIMLLPQYRRGTLGMRLFAAYHSIPVQQLGISTCYGQTVCDGPAAQTLSYRQGARTTALELDTMPPVSREPGGPSSNRSSLLFMFIIMEDTPHTVLLPERYEDILRKVYSNLLVRRTFSIGSAMGSSSTSFQQNTFQAMGQANLLIQNIGKDLTAVIRAWERSQPGMHCYKVALPLDDPSLPWATDRMRELGFFLCGLLPNWNDRDMILMQKLSAEPDYEGIYLYEDIGKELLQHIKTERAELAAF